MNKFMNILESITKNKKYLYIGIGLLLILIVLILFFMLKQDKKEEVKKEDR